MTKSDKEVSNLRLSRSPLIFFEQNSSPMSPHYVHCKGKGLPETGGYRVDKFVFIYLILICSDDKINLG